MEVAMEQDTLNQKWITTSLTKDQQMFIYRWYPLMGSIWCSNELGVNIYKVRDFASSAGIPGIKHSQEYSIAEIAEKLGMTKIEVQSIFNSAMEKLRRKADERLKDYL